MKITEMGQIRLKDQNLFYPPIYKSLIASITDISKLKSKVVIAFKLTET